MEENYTVPSVALVPVPEQDAVLIAFKGEINRLLEYAERANVTDLATAKDATNDIATCRTIAKAIEDTRKRYKAPIIEAGKEVDRFFESLAGPLKLADKTYSDKVLGYHQEQERQRKEIERLNALAEEKARIEREIAERQAREERERLEKEQREAEIIAKVLNEPPPPPLVYQPAPVVEQPKPLEVPDQQKHVRSEAGTLGFTWVLEKEKVEAALANGIREIAGLVIWLEPRYKVLDIKKVPEEYKRQSTRVTR
jgi:hypothetical protein